MNCTVRVLPGGRPTFAAAISCWTGRATAATGSCRYTWTTSTRIGFFLRILLPLSRPTPVTVAVLAFVQSWNQYLIPLLVFTSQQRFTPPLAVANFLTERAQNTTSILAFTALSMLPALGYFIFAQRHLVGGFTGGG